MPASMSAALSKAKAVRPGLLFWKCPLAWPPVVMASRQPCLGTKMASRGPSGCLTPARGSIWPAIAISANCDAQKSRLKMRLEHSKDLFFALLLLNIYSLKCWPYQAHLEGAPTPSTGHNHSVDDVFALCRSQVENTSIGHFWTSHLIDPCPPGPRPRNNPERGQKQSSGALEDKISFAAEQKLKLSKVVH